MTGIYQRGLALANEGVLIRLLPDGGDEMEVAREAAGLRDSGFCGERESDSLRVARQPPIQVALVRGVAVLVTPWRPVLLQFLGSLLKVLVNRTPDEFSNRSARLVGQR